MTPLTPRELDVLRLAAQGLTDRQIAARLGTATSTVGAQVMTAMRRLGARTRAHACSLLDDRYPGWREPVAAPREMT